MTYLHKRVLALHRDKPLRPLSLEAAAALTAAGYTHIEARPGFYRAYRPTPDGWEATNLLPRGDGSWLLDCPVVPTGACPADARRLEEVTS